MFFITSDLFLYDKMHGPVITTLFSNTWTAHLSFVKNQIKPVWRVHIPLTFIYSIKPNQLFSNFIGCLYFGIDLSLCRISLQLWCWYVFICCSLWNIFGSDTAFVRGVRWGCTFLLTCSIKPSRLFSNSIGSLCFGRTFIPDYLFCDFVTEC